MLFLKIKSPPLDQIYYILYALVKIEKFWFPPCLGALVCGHGVEAEKAETDVLDQQGQTHRQTLDPRLG